MADYFWYFILYSFLGFVLEVAFARATHNPKRDRKCLVFLPLCPVYGLGAVLLLLLPAALRRRPLLLFPVAAAVCACAEYLTGLFYEKATGVVFWDYSHLPCQLHGRVCLSFSLLWGGLALILIRFLHPPLAALVSAIPAPLTLPALLFFLADSALSLYLLRREGTTDALRWYLPRADRARAPR